MEKFFEIFFGIIEIFIKILISIPIIVIYFFVLFMAWLTDKKTYSKNSKKDECYYGPLS